MSLKPGIVVFVRHIVCDILRLCLLRLCNESLCGDLAALNARVASLEEGGVTVKTVVGRLETGVLMEEKPCYALNYGEYVPEILEIDQQLRGVLFEGAEA